MSIGALATVLLCAGSACASAQDEGSSIVAASADQFDVIQDLRADLREWNRHSAKFVGAYLDDTVGVDEFVVISTGAIEEMEGVLRRMRGRDSSGLPAEVLSPVEDVLSFYSDKLSAINRITTSVDVGDGDGEQSGVTALERANSGATSSACELADVLKAAGAEPDAGSEFGC